MRFYDEGKTCRVARSLNRHIALRNAGQSLEVGLRTGEYERKQLRIYKNRLPADDVVAV